MRSEGEFPAAAVRAGGLEGEDRIAVPSIHLFHFTPQNCTLVDPLSLGPLTVLPL